MVSDAEKRLRGERRKRCYYCQTLTYDWEIVDGTTRCWPCGKRIRKLYGGRLDSTGKFSNKRYAARTS